MDADRLETGQVYRLEGEVAEQASMPAAVVPNVSGVAPD